MTPSHLSPEQLSQSSPVPWYADRYMYMCTTQTLRQLHNVAAACVGGFHNPQTISKAKLWRLQGSRGPALWHTGLWKVKSSLNNWVTSFDYWCLNYALLQNEVHTCNYTQASYSFLRNKFPGLFQDFFQDSEAFFQDSQAHILSIQWLHQWWLCSLNKLYMPCHTQLRQ